MIKKNFYLNNINFWQLLPIAVIFIFAVFFASQTALAIGDTFLPPGGAVSCTGYGFSCGALNYSGTLSCAPMDPAPGSQFCSPSTSENGACQNSWTVADNYSWVIKSAWEMRNYNWDDFMQYWSKVNGATLSGGVVPSPGCACGSGCAGASSSYDPYGYTFFDRYATAGGAYQNTDVTLEMGVRGINTYTSGASPTSFARKVWGVNLEYCGGGDGKIGRDGQCRSVTANTFTVSLSTCTAPCNVTVAWNTNSNDHYLAPGRNGVDIYRNTVEHKTHQAISGNFTDSNLGNGIYNYCIRGYDGGGYIPYVDGSYYGIQTANLQCASVTVSSAVPAIGAKWKDNNLETITINLTPGQISTGPINLNYWNSGVSGSVLRVINCTYTKSGGNVTVSTPYCPSVILTVP